jgi:glycosyltransferase involved in cell wall biosynthesis
VVIEEAIGGERAPFLSKLLSGSPTIQFWYQDNRPLFAASYGRLGAAIGGSLQRILLWVNRSGFALGNSEATRTWIVTQGFASERTAVSYPKVDVSSAPQNPMQFETRPDRFISIGNFRPLKRFEEAIETLVRLRKDNPRAELALVGRQADADYLGRLRALAAEQAVGRHVRFVVDASDKEKFQLLSESKVLTIHSPIEGFGWTIPEAGLCGVPVVGNPGVPMDSLREGVNGTRVPFGDVEAYARVVNQLFSDREVWVGYSVRAREVALEFARNRVESDVLSLLKRCIGRSSEAEDPGDE